MVLNPESEYFKSHYQKPGDYFRKIKHMDFEEILERISKFFEMEAEYFLGIRGKEIFDTRDKKFAALYVIKGIKI